MSAGCLTCGRKLMMSTSGPGWLRYHARNLQHCGLQTRRLERQDDGRQRGATAVAEIPHVIVVDV